MEALLARFPRANPAVATAFREAEKQLLVYRADVRMERGFDKFATPEMGGDVYAA